MRTLLASLLLVAGLTPAAAASDFVPLEPGAVGAGTAAAGEPAQWFRVGPFPGLRSIACFLVAPEDATFELRLAQGSAEQPDLTVPFGDHTGAGTTQWGLVAVSEAPFLWLSVRAVAGEGPFQVLTIPSWSDPGAAGRMQVLALQPGDRAESTLRGDGHALWLRIVPGAGKVVLRVRSLGAADVDLLVLLGDGRSPTLRPWFGAALGPAPEEELEVEAHGCDLWVRISGDAGPFKFEAAAGE